MHLAIYVHVEFNVILMVLTLVLIVMNIFLIFMASEIAEALKQS